MIQWQPRKGQKQRRTRLVLALTIKLAVSAIALSALINPRPWIVYNASASVPLGWYQVDPPGPVKRGELVLVNLPDTMRALADERQYVPKTVPLIKPVAAHDADEVCAEGEVILINGRSVGTRQRKDRTGRDMPRWSGCRRLAEDEVFLFNANSPLSFDGRYFGVTKASAIIGKVRPL